MQRMLFKMLSNKEMKTLISYRKDLKRDLNRLEEIRKEDPKSDFWKKWEKLGWNTYDENIKLCRNHVRYDIRRIRELEKKASKAQISKAKKIARKYIKEVN